ncbi:MAG TPA: hypothetical protein VLJ16_06400 [Acidobacteriota bacterium]|nr:hypothetical protein [Acidobacteriota bacterium]
MDPRGLLRRQPPGFRDVRRALAALLIFAAVHAAPATAIGDQKRPDVPGLLREIRDEVATLPKYPGEDFARGEFFLGEGDDDTNKTHAVGILVKDGDAAGTRRMTIVVSRLEPARDDPRVKFTRDSKTIVGAFAADRVEIVRSDYSEAELEKLLPVILKAVTDKKALLKKGPIFL